MIRFADISSAVSHALPHYYVHEAYLFGSFAYGEQTPESEAVVSKVPDGRLVLHLLSFVRILDIRYWSQGATNGIKRKPTEKILVAEHDQRNQNNAR